MKLIIGLGNPGEKYKNSRHNVGSTMIDFIIEQIKNEKLKIKNYNEKLKYDKYAQAEIVKIEINNEKIILVKPKLFMNQSGHTVKSSVARYKIDIENELYVIHDDLDIRIGEYKIQKGKGPKLHNGIVSIENALSTSDFWRVRIGIDNRDKDNRIPGDGYVLKDFLREEKEKLSTVFTDILDSCQYPKVQ